MRASLIAIGMCAAVLFVVSGVFANPAMLPHHPGYPMGKAVDPVDGQALANDSGQTNATGERSITNAAMFDDRQVTQSLSAYQDNMRIVEKLGAGVLPKVQGPNITIDPPLKEATKVNAAP